MANIKLSNNVKLDVASVANGSNMSNALTYIEGTTAAITWVATQDCWIRFHVNAHGGQHTYGYINNVEVLHNYDKGENGINGDLFVFIKQGQTVKMTKTAYHTGYPFSISAYACF